MATKKYDPRKAPIRTELVRHNLPLPGCDLENEEKYRKILRHFVLPAREMYQGSFKYVRNLVGSLRKNDLDADLWIISARYGLISEKTTIIPYDCTFQGISKKEIRAKAERLRIYAKLLQLLAENKYNQTFVILGREYLLSVLDPETMKDFTRYLKGSLLIVLAAESTRAMFKYAPMRFIPVKGIGDRNSKIRELASKTKTSLS